MFVLGDLWRGNISTVERYIRPESEYKKTLKASTDKADKMLSYLSPEGQQLFYEYFELTSKLTSISEEEAFICGFRLGAKMMLDILCEYKGQFRTAAEG